MGIVYEAIQISLNRRVALKVLSDASVFDPRHLQRFHVEAQAAASLSHPHIVPVFATGSAGGAAYYAMRFIDGRDLAAVIREQRRDGPVDTHADLGGAHSPERRSPEKRLSVGDVARLARQAAEALGHAHANDVLHCDIKPSNLLIDEAVQLWITDFGLARMRGGLDLTHTCDALGTPRYMSPEQAAGRHDPLDCRTDIYSLGVTIYELLTLRPAFSGDDPLEILRQIVQEEPIPPRKLDPSIPIDLETIVLKAMAKSRVDRYATATELADELGRFLEQRPILARRPSVVDCGAKWLQRHRALVACLSAAASVIAVTLAYAGWHYTSLLREHNAALVAAVTKAEEQAREAARHRRIADRHRFASIPRLAGRAIDARQFETARDLLDSGHELSLGDEPRDFGRYLCRLPESASRPRWRSRPMVRRPSWPTDRAWSRSTTQPPWRGGG